MPSKKKIMRKNIKEEESIKNQHNKRAKQNSNKITPEFLLIGRDGVVSPADGYVARRDCHLIGEQAGIAPAGKNR